MSIPSTLEKSTPRKLLIIAYVLVAIFNLIGFFQNRNSGQFVINSPLPGVSGSQRENTAHKSLSWAPSTTSEQNKLGLQMASILLVAVLLVYKLKPSTLEPIHLFSPVLVTFFSLPILGLCPTCTVGTDLLSTLTRFTLPLLPLLMVLSAWSGIQNSKLRYFAGTLFPLAICLTQCLLLITRPKFCLFCLGLGLVLVICIRLADAPDTDRPRIKPMPAALVSMLLLSMTTSVSLGYVNTIPAVNQINEPQFVGRRIEEFGQAPPKSSSLYVVSIEGCKSCQSAKAYLESHSIPFVKLQFCGAIESPTCFKTKAKTIAPLLLQVNSNGMITKQFSGWNSSDSGSKEILSYLASNK